MCRDRIRTMNYVGIDLSSFYVRGQCFTVPSFVDSNTIFYRVPRPDLRLNPGSLRKADRGALRMQKCVPRYIGRIPGYQDIYLAPYC